MPTTYFITGTTYEVEYPDNYTGDFEEIYDAWCGDGEMPEGCSVDELEVTHYWEGEAV